MIYLVLMSGEEKQGQTDPTILQFRSQAHLSEWRARGGDEALEIWEQGEIDCYGGWPTVVEVSPQKDQDADLWLAEREDE